MNEEIKKLLSIISEGQNSIQLQEIKKYITNLQEENQKLKERLKENIELKSKITKVIEYLENNNLYNKDDLFINMILLNILKGEN